MSSSPWIRGAPQLGFARCIARLRARSSTSIVGRPGPRERLFHRQYKRNPRRCHRITVAGRKRTSAWRHPGQPRDNHAQRIRSEVRNRTRPPRALALEYEKLMAKSDPLRMERGSAPKETQECAEKGQEGRRQHRCRLIARRKHQHCQPGSGFREPHGSSRRWTLTSRVRPAPGVHLGLQGAPRNSP